MLQSAPAADSEMRAARYDPLGRALDELEQFTFIVLAMPAPASEADRLPGQRASDEHRLAAVHDALALVRECAHCAGLDRRRGRCHGIGPGPRRSASWRSRTHHLAQMGAAQARRNSVKCGSDEACRWLRTRSISSAYCARASAPRRSEKRR